MRGGSFPTSPPPALPARRADFPVSSQVSSLLGKEHHFQAVWLFLSHATHTQPSCRFSPISSQATISHLLAEQHLPRWLWKHLLVTGHTLPWTSVSGSKTRKKLLRLLHQESDGLPSWQHLGLLTWLCCIQGFPNSLSHKTLLPHNINYVPQNSLKECKEVWSGCPRGIELEKAICPLLASSHSVTQSCPTLCSPMNCSTPALPVHHQLLESTQTHVHWVSDAIQPCHPG